MPEPRHIEQCRTKSASASCHLDQCGRSEALQRGARPLRLPQALNTFAGLIPTISADPLRIRVPFSGTGCHGVSAHLIIALTHTVSECLANAQRQQRILQWVTPSLTLVMIVLAAQRGEQQRPLKGFAMTTWKNLRKSRARHDRKPPAGALGCMSTVRGELRRHRLDRWTN